MIDLHRFAPPIAGLAPLADAEQRLLPILSEVTT